uniref:NAA35-like TPR repeats domain-containing protein n=1 Tax=Glossina palpalis gambiensis TaxID=67801 RepID=A0A1B0BZE4_9MUSC
MDMHYVANLCKKVIPFKRRNNVKQWYMGLFSWAESRGDRFLFKSKEQTEQKEETLYVDVQDLYFAASEALMSRLSIKGLCKMVGATKESKDRIGLNKLEALVLKMVFMCVPEAIRKSSETQSCYAILQVTKINYVVLNVLPKASQKDLKRQPDFDFSKYRHFPIIKLN